MLERGKAVRERTRDTWELCRKRTLHPESNVQFGEGGAVTGRQVVQSDSRSAAPGAQGIGMAIVPSLAILMASPPRRYRDAPKVPPFGAYSFGRLWHGLFA